MFDNERQIPYAYGKGEWVGYDDVQSLQAKVSFAVYLVDRFFIICEIAYLSVLISLNFSLPFVLVLI